MTQTTNLQIPIFQVATDNVGADKKVMLTYEFKYVKPGKYNHIHPVYHIAVCLTIFNLLFTFRISSNKHRASKMSRSLISAAPLSIHIETSASL